MIMWTETVIWGYKLTPADDIVISLFLLVVVCIIASAWGGEDE